MINPSYKKIEEYILLHPHVFPNLIYFDNNEGRFLPNPTGRDNERDPEKAPD